MDPIAQAFMHLADVFLDTWTIVTCGAVYFAIRFLNRIPQLANNSLWHRVVPFLPDVFGICLSLAKLIPACAAQPALVRGAVGLWIGYISSRFYKLLQTTVLGDDDKIVSLAIRARSGSADTAKNPDEKEES